MADNLRLVNAHLVQTIADKELTADEAGAVQFVLAHTPTVEAVPVVCGQWENFPFTGLPWKYMCDRCKNPVVQKSHFCPECGAKMDLPRRTWRD